ncbi:hypothetical protein SAMD00023353_2100730 [Rosellinia necatrix]|uniref:PD-(D/E)XK nuclease-like domain-containing protein n=1 Tax=Rosellinia necatrix TaxID=77044 RepID=A0A1W2TFH4_ROSNE|nr:hypothetical protein SAMD00023353_2100730 [Rosellinia necatrix]
MDATIVLAWLTDVVSSLPSPSFGSHPSPSLPRPSSRASLARRNQHLRKTSGHLPPAAFTRDDQAAKTPPRRRSPRKKVTTAGEDEEAAVAEEPLQLGRMSAALDKIDASVSRPPPSAADFTDTTSRSRSLFSQTLSQATFPAPSNTNTDTDGRTSLRTGATGSSRTRSQSPIKQANDLIKLHMPVYWRDVSLAELSRRLDERKSANLLKSINGVLRKGYLPEELREILDSELGLDNSDDMLYSTTPSIPFSDSQLRRARYLAGTGLLPDGDGPELKKSLSPLIHLQLLLDELETLSAIVATTKEYGDIPRAEASWNERVHGRMLHLALSHTPGVGVENVTRANIAKDFLPPTSARHVSLPAGSKLIDYAMVLKPSPTFQDEEPDRKTLSLERVVYFVDKLAYPSFNQSSYSPLCNMPSGIFIGTKVNTQKSTEAKAQLGMWLASWYGRVFEFPNIGPDVLPPPVLPILLVQAGTWELHFAFDAGSHYDVCGCVSIGSTNSLDGVYRLLAVLRILAKWMETDFLRWVEECLQRAGV